MKKIIIPILIMFLMLELYGCASKTILLEDVLKQEHKNLGEFLNAILCQDTTNFLELIEIKTNQNIYYILDCTKLVTKNGDISGYRLELYLPDEYRIWSRPRILARDFVIDIFQNYCNISQGKFGDNGHDLQLEYLLKNTKYFNFYLKKLEEKKRNIRNMEIPAYYKKEFLKLFLSSITLTLPPPYNIYCISPKESLVVSSLSVVIRKRYNGQ